MPSPKEIEKMAINYVVKYLRSKGENPKVVKKGIDIISGKKWIEVKGCMKKETNIRVTNQTIEYVKKHKKQDDFYIYWVWEMESENPKLQIFDWDTFKNNWIIEKKWIIQPNRIYEKTKKPKIIPLKSIK